MDVQKHWNNFLGTYIILHNYRVTTKSVKFLIAIKFLIELLTKTIK